MRLLSSLLLLASLSVLAAKDRDWKTGKVLDSQSAKTYVQTGSSTAGSGSGSAISSGGMTTASAQTEEETQIHNMSIQTTQLLILGDEYAYVVNDSVEKAVGPTLHGSLSRAIANRKHGCRYVVGDPILYAQSKNALYVRDADGKECKLEIARQERLQTIHK